MPGNNEPRTIKLLCPSLSKLVTLVAWEEQKLDLGSIARAFGLDPSTVKLNGHFISRGVDLVSSSVTWRSLLSFFSAKGLSTGKDNKDALIVDGKLCKVGTKRAHDPQDAVDGICNATESKDIGAEDINLLKNKRLRDSNSESEEGDHPASKCNGLGFKRKQSFEDLHSLKKLKINETDPDFQGRGNNNHARSSARHRFACSYLNENVKRTREDEVVVAAPCKTIK